MTTLINNTLHQTQMVTLRSREYTQRLNGDDNSDILFQLSQPINVPPNVDIYVTLNVFRFINGMYNVPNSSHIFYWRGFKNGVWDEYQYSVQIGNWNIDNLITDLNANVSDFTFTYDSKTFRVTVEAQGTHIQYEILPNTNNILARIGFEENKLISVLPTQTITSPNLIDLLGTQNLYINIDDLQLASNSTLGFGHSNVLEHIAVVVPQGTGQTYSSQGLMMKCGVKKITQLRVQLYTGEDKLAELNNTEWYMSLLFNFQYENEFKPARYMTDVNGDGKIDFQDLLAMYNYGAKV
jgi:hypothetical protein